MSELNFAGSSRLRVCKRTLATTVAACIFALWALLGVQGVSAQAARSAHDKPVLIMPFDLYDYSLDHRPTTVEPLRRWVAGLAEHIARNVRHGVSLSEIGGTKALAALREVRSNYPHPTQCRSCMISIARHAGAGVVVVGQVHKLSNLITYFDVQVEDVRSGRVLHVIHMRADGADSNVMWRRIARNIAGRVGRIVEDGH